MAGGSFSDGRAGITEPSLIIAERTQTIENVAASVGFGSDDAFSRSFQRRFGVRPPDMTRGARLAALRLAVTYPSRLQAAPGLAGIAGLYVGNAAIVGSEDAMGAVLVFEPAMQKSR